MLGFIWDYFVASYAGYRIANDSGFWMFDRKAAASYLESLMITKGLM